MVSDGKIDGLVTLVVAFLYTYSGEFKIFRSVLTGVELSGREGSAE